MLAATSIADEVRALKADNGLLKLANEQLANNYRQADQCATEREAQILSLLNQRDGLVGALESTLKIAESWIHDQLDGTTSLQRALAELESARALLQQIREGK